MNRKLLRLEPLEERVLLAVSPAEFNKIRDLYPDLGLSANMADYNVIEITAAQLSVANLKSAITEAGTTTTKPDLIVLCTTATQNKITFAVRQLGTFESSGISINGTQGGITIVALGSHSLTIDANQQGRVMDISGTVNLANLTIINGSYSNGGGISNSGVLRIMNSAICANFASQHGGGIYNGGTLTITNSTISGNSTSGNGGGIWGTSSLTVTNCTVTGNFASQNGGAWYGSPTNLRNTIVAKNSAKDSTETESSISKVTGSNNLIGGDPKIGELTEINGWLVHPLLTGSPAIDAGNTQWIPAGVTTDQVGNPRIAGARVDIGAVERVTETQRTGQIYTITNLNDFHDALEAANFNKQVGSSPAGSFTEQDKIVFAPNVSGTITLSGMQLKILGSLIIDASSANITIKNNISANGGNATSIGRVFYINAKIDVELRNLTITNGKSSYHGGGIYNSGGRLTVINCVISGNLADHQGGGIYNVGGQLTVTNSTISGNAGSGGGIYNYFGTTTLYNTIVAKNSSNDIVNTDGTVTGSNNLIGIDPIFERTGTAIGLNYNPGEWDFQLQGTSPAINAGSNERAKYANGSTIQYDLARNPRIFGDIVDIGAYEIQRYSLSTPTLNATNISTSGLTLSWNAVTNASSYTLQYRKAGDSTWTTINHVTSPRNITGLIAGTQYEFQLKTVGGVLYSDSKWSSSKMIWTLCNAPTGVSATAQN